MKKAIIILCFGICFNYTYGQTFTLKSNDLGGQISDNQIFNGFGCSGKNISPQLQWENPPEGTKSFAITMYDPDAPTGSGWWHWVVFNIPADIQMLKTDAGNLAKELMPKDAIQSKTDFGNAGFGGACPPKGDGDHQYIITVHALKVEKLDLTQDANPALVGFYLHSNRIAKASIVAYYKR